MEAVVGNSTLLDVVSIFMTFCVVVIGSEINEIVVSSTSSNSIVGAASWLSFSVTNSSESNEEKEVVSDTNSLS